MHITKKEKQNPESVANQKLAYSINELAQMTSLSPGFFRSEILAGRLIAHSFGKRVLVMRKYWLLFIEKQKRWAPKKSVEKNQ